MSVDYAAGLSDYDDLGDCGLDEVFDKISIVKQKVALLASWMQQMKGSCVVHVGAGLSTAAGIPDFRGKRGVWTEKLRNLSKSEHKPQTTTDEQTLADQASIKEEGAAGETGAKIKPFDSAEPTTSHLALRELCRLGYIGYIVSQNVDGLFLKANLERKFISELHGNFYLDECTRCRSRYIRATASKSMRLQKSNLRCPRPSSSKCAGYLRDTILDWESPIPFNELRVAQRESKHNKLHICIGTSLQLRPSKDLVCDPLKNKSTKLVVINLQPTRFDEKANLVINYYADDVMKLLFSELDLTIPTYDPDQDPTKRPEMVGQAWKKY